MRSRTIAGLVLAGAGMLAACGGGAGGYNAGSPAPAAAKTTSASTPVKTSPSQFGDHLVDAGGRTLYGFTNDVNGTSTCAAACAQTWHPLTVGADWKAETGLPGAKLHTITRTDGQLQLAAGKWPLYTFAGDNTAGEVNGQGSLGKWFVVQPDAKLHKGITPAATAITAPPAMTGYGY